MTENSTGFTVGGRLHLSNQTYVHRTSDDELLQELTKGNYCYILNARQTGKSSLRIKIVDRLKKCNPKVDSVIIDLNNVAISQMNWRQWCFAITETIAKAESLRIMTTKELDQWWKSFGDDIAPLQRHINFLEEYVLKQLDRRVVIFIDEADRLFSFSEPANTDAFFAFIRSCSEKREPGDDNNPYNRLTYCIVGTTSPNNFIRDPKSTPFNLGQAITLEPFKLDEVQPLITMLGEKLQTSESASKELMEEIIHWTGGQPFLTQKLCHLIVKERQSNPFTTVEQVVNLKVINNWQTQDEPVHFQTIEKRLLDNEAKAFDRLGLYKEVWENEQIHYQNTPEQIELTLSGLVLEDEGQLRLYNPIYKDIFNLNWVEQEKAKLRLYIEEFENWEKWEKWKETNNLAYDLQERYLLYGTKCDRVQQWRIKFNKDNGKLYEKEGNFLDRSETFWQEVKNLFSDLQINEGTMESIIQSANDLTGGLHKFNRIVFNIAKNNNVVDLQQDEVQGWLENLVLSHLNRFKDDELFIKDQGQFSNQDDASIDSFALISTFEKIYQKEPIRFDEKNPQHRKLKDMCFIILDKEHNLRILNKIYEKILDQNWIKEVMAGLRPYKKAFRGWQDSDRQESSYLLQNNDLKLALEWLGKKPTPKLEEGEIEFVMTSLVAEVWAKASPSVQSEAVSLITTFRPSLQGKNNYSDFLLREILQWTRHEPLLLRELLEVVNKTEIFTTNYHNWIEQLVKTQIINNWQDSKLAEHFRLIEQRLTNHQSSESFWLIVKYRQILLQGKIEFDEIREDTKLIELGLVVKLDQQLEIANPIYENIFSQRWTYQKLSECKRIRAINLLKWCRANIPEQNDPVLRSYLDEWINNNATIIEKIVQEAKGEVLDNKFDFIDEIKLLTYDIMGMRTSDTPQISIQHSLNRIFKDDVKKMAQNNDLDSLLNKIVENATEIEAIVILGLKAGMVSGKNSNLESNNSSLYQIVRSETLVSFAKLKTIPDILDNFGEKTNFGKLSYVMFTLEKGVVISHFTKIQGNPFAICFISNSEVDMPGLFLAQCEGKFEKIQEELEKVLR
ncbi:AAA-like domain-containing protein [Microcystis sp. M169S2]|uniref:AAA-like domain-containing protein n=1 Tax=Microcystis sp. M169S2 TaxID=2771157 RepID=UPI0025880C30|nr:AAA-like domain-containing protein [Microcystis sp. M169S2]MCA2718145.1 AAA-like domain-containing protein [Microcystis sp. M169S2]